MDSQQCINVRLLISLVVKETCNNRWGCGEALPKTKGAKECPCQNRWCWEFFSVCRSETERKAQVDWRQWKYYHHRYHSTQVIQQQYEHWKLTRDISTLQGLKCGAERNEGTEGLVEVRNTGIFRKCINWNVCSLQASGITECQSLTLLQYINHLLSVLIIEQSPDLLTVWCF